MGMLATTILLATLTATMHIAPPAEPGERLVITGRLLRADGRTPAAGVTLFAYQTNAKGRYVERDGKPHGLSGRLRTDAQGRYRIETIRPGAYPGRTDPAHIHLVLEPSGTYIDTIIFDDDPRTNAVRGRDGYAIVKLARRNEIWVGARDIVIP